MTTNEIYVELSKANARLCLVKDEITALCSTLVPILKDKGLDNLAEEFSRRLFEIDAIHGEIAALARAHPDAFIGVILGHVKGPNP